MISHQYAHLLTILKQQIWYRPKKLRGFVRAYRSAASGSNPKQTKRTKINEKGTWLIFKNKCKPSQKIKALHITKIKLTKMEYLISWETLHRFLHVALKQNVFILVWTLVLWSQEETYNQEVVGLNPGSEY